MSATLAELEAAGAKAAAIRTALESLAATFRAQADWLDLPINNETPRPYISREQFRAAAEIISASIRPPDPAAAELAEALKAILADMPIIDCDRLHHTKKDVHGDSICPVEIRLDAAVSRARVLLAKHAAKP